jgi:DNA-binding IclR family transcriptional regulator
MAPVILANLSPSQLRSIHSWNAEKIRDSGLGDTIEAFLARMAEIRNAGVTMSQSEVFEGLVGIAAPVRDSEERVLGSVVFVLSVERLAAANTGELSQEIRNIAAEIEHGMARTNRFAATTPVAAARPRRVPVYRG